MKFLDALLRGPYYGALVLFAIQPTTSLPAALLVGALAGFCEVLLVCAFRFVLRQYMRLRYGVKGGLRPPIGYWYDAEARELSWRGRIIANPSRLRRWLVRRRYRFAWFCWRFEEAAYQFTGLPLRWYQNHSDCRNVP